MAWNPVGLNELSVAYNGFAMVQVIQSLSRELEKMQREIEKLQREVEKKK